MAETLVTNRQLDIADGWIPAQETWTYASANSFTISGVDRTARYPAGTKLKFTDSGTKYKVVASVSFSTNTTVTTADDDDNDFTSGAITNPFYSYQENPQGFPSYFSYSPTWTGFSSDPTADLMYTCSGNVITIFCPSINGTSNSATLNFSLPVTPDIETGTLAVPCAAYDANSWQNSLGVIGILNNNTTGRVGKTGSTISANTYAGFTATNSKGFSGTVTFPFS